MLFCCNLLLLLVGATAARSNSGTNTIESPKKGAANGLTKLPLQPSHNADAAACGYDAEGMDLIIARIASDPASVSTVISVLSTATDAPVCSHALCKAMNLEHICLP